MSASSKLHVDAHAKFVHKLDEKKDSMTTWTMQHLKVSGVYWGLSAMAVMKKLDEFPKDEITQFVLKCQNEDGGFGGNARQDSHMLYTLSAVQVLCILGTEDAIPDKIKVAKWVAGLQKEDGSFTGDKWGEVDTRFSYIALNCLGLLGQLDLVNLDKTVEFVLKCQNWDGGFGVLPGAESHAAQMFCCLGALKIAKALDKIDQNKVATWLAERQLPSGGLNGRPEKKHDVCYSWWVLSCMAMMDKLDWISQDGLIHFILNCQDFEDGGIADKPGNWPDVYHTFFGVAGLSLMGFKGCPLNPIDPTFAMPPDTLKRLGIDWV